jgi:periplasmic protein TonB
MRILAFSILLLAAAFANAARAADAVGCADLKLLPRLEGCVITECSAKQHETFEAPEGSAGPTEGSLNALTYSCPAAMDLARIQRELDAEIRKAGYLSVAPVKTENGDASGTARKGSRWLHWAANFEDGTPSYSLSSASSGAEKFKAEACGEMPALAPLKQCEVVECASKSEDSVALRTAEKGETSLSGNVQSFLLACPAWGAAQAFPAVEGELKSSGYEILFRASEHPESGWITGRSGKRWIEFASGAEGESTSYALTVIPAAEVLSAATPASAQPEPAPVAVPSTPVPEPAVTPVTPVIAAAPVPEPSETSRAPEPRPEPAIAAQIAEPAPKPAPSTALSPAAAAAAKANYLPPKLISRVEIEPTHERIFSVTGDVVINVLVDVGEDGTVTKAVLAPRPSKGALVLESAAIQAVSHWRFEPARQDGRVVPAAKVAVQLRFHGRPWQM